MQVLAQLKGLNLDALVLEEAIAYLAFAKLVRKEYEDRSLGTPEWLDARVRELTREVSLKTEDALRKRLADLNAQEEKMLPAEERRARIRAEREAVEKALAGQ